MIKIHFDSEIRKNEQIYINQKDIVGFYNCSIEQERKVTELIKYYCKEKRVKEIGFKKEEQKDCFTVYQYLYEKSGSLLNKEYVIDGFLELGELESFKNELVSNLSLSDQYCLELLLAYIQGADVIILHRIYEKAWSHTIEKILIEFSLVGAAIIFVRSGQESLVNLPIHSYDFNNKTAE